MRFQVLELDGARLDRVQHRLQALIKRKAPPAPATRIRPMRRWLWSWDPVRQTAVRRLPAS